MTSQLTHKRILAMILVMIIGFSGGIFIKTMLRVGEGEDVDITAIRQANEALLEEKERYGALQAQNADLEDEKAHPASPFRRLRGHRRHFDRTSRKCLAVGDDRR